MKKQRKFFWVGVLLMALFIVVSLLTFHQSRDWIVKGYLASEGSAAESFAVLTAANIHLTDARVEELKRCSYAELLQTEENQALWRMMDDPDLGRKVDYAYVMIHLRDDDVRYAVTEESKGRFEAPLGTPLDIMWLLDVNVSSEAEQASRKDELDRYSYYMEEDERIFSDAPTYLFRGDEWGDHICGYAPLYSVEGHYIGVVGVDLRVGDYRVYCDRAVLALGVLMTVSLLTLSLLFAYVSLHYRRVQFDKVYTDPLTRVYNRSYYNNLFFKRLSARRDGALFALMIADVDWFKNVNDTFGHEVGDEVLIELGAILTESFGKERVVRFGGEEFVAGLWVNSPDELEAAFRLLYGRIAEHRFSSRAIELTISLGCSYCEARDLNGWLTSGMLRAADCKLYEAKEGGRKRYLLEPYDEKKDYRKAGDDARASRPMA